MKNKRDSKRRVVELWFKKNNYTTKRENDTVDNFASKRIRIFKMKTKEIQSEK